MASNPLVVVKCPTCRKPVSWSASEPFKPFCSERCRLIDLGDWATEAHKIPGTSMFPEQVGAEDDELSAG